MNEARSSEHGAYGERHEPERAALTRGLAAAIARRLDRGETVTAASTRFRTRTAPPDRAPVADETPAPARARSVADTASRSIAAPASEKPGVAENRRKALESADLRSLRALVADCRACELCQTRTQTVFADGKNGGTEKARVFFIGEAPGQNEDEQGVPFVGRAGRLLTDIIEKGMGLRRDEVYIANVLKCRPPGNRDPKPAEKALCTPFLDRQIELVDPDILIPLGLHATQHLLRSTESMGRLRGRVHLRDGRKVVPTYHPAYLLRSPSMKKECWKDIQIAMDELGLPRPT